jgi:hypothetical protein
VVAEPALGARLGLAGMRRAWALATVFATLCPFGLAVWLAPAAGARPVAALVLINVALLLGLALNRASHLHDDTGISRAVFGAYLGLSTAHFIIDAGLWRLREEFPRAFLTERLPYLLATPIAPVRTDRVHAGSVGDAIAGD